MANEFPLATDFQVEDYELPCPYLPNKTALLRYWLPGRKVGLEEAEKRMRAGQRRHGQLVYIPNCPTCSKCISLRIPVAKFAPTKSQRHILNRCRREFRVSIDQSMVDQNRLDLLNKHHRWRGWVDATDIGFEDYHNSFVGNSFETFEICYFHGDRLIGVAICDRGKSSLSAVYTYYDPEFSKFSLGTFSILTQIDFCTQNHLEFLYLGFYVKECESLNYKANFSPYQKLIDGRWIDSDR